jgi:hypothetical protein
MVKWLWVVKDESRFVFPLLLIGALLFSISSCKHNPVGPPPGADTTSNNFTWTHYTFGGQGGSSYFSDVAILNDTLAFAVGDIYANDSSGQSNSQPYNLAIWNGKTWSLQRLIANGYPPPIKCIFALNDHDVWLSPWFHWDGQSFQQVASDPMFFGVGINRIWGDQNGIYAVGTNGFIAHRDLSGAWTQLQSGTSLPIQDIWGATNPKTGKEDILAVASNVLALPQGKKLLEISGNNVTAVSDSGLPLALSSVWFIPGWKYFIGGDGLYSSNAVGNSWESDTVINPSQYTFSIRGTGEDDIFMVGGYGLVSHWNGRTLRQYTELGSFYGNYYSVDFKGNMAVTVGIMPGPTINTEGVILMGTRR